VSWGGTELEESVEIDGIILAYAKDRRVAAMEILDASTRTTQDPLNHVDVSVVRQATKRSSGDQPLGTLYESSANGAA
jgi:hypothetical protein